MLNELKIFNPKRKILIIALLLSLLFLISFFIRNKLLVGSIDIKSLSKESVILENESTRFYNLSKQTGYLYKSEKKGEEAVKDFLTQEPKADNKLIIPENFINNSEMTRKVDDKTDEFLKKRDINLSNEHYVFNQKIKNIPVYGGQLSVHLKNENEIYALEGNVVMNQNITQQKITEEKARQIALERSNKDSGNEEAKLKIQSSQKYIINKKILGISDDEKNYLTLGVIINSGDPLNIFSKIYFIDLNAGNVIYEESKIFNVLNRQVYSCGGGNCQLVRGEGAGQSSDRDADNIYNFLGEIYNYYYSTFQRDSYDSIGAALKSYVHYPMQCPNAAWVPEYQAMFFCTGMATKDIAAHEQTHAVTNLTANLVYQSQSGALNESISDIFAYEVDSNWELGEGSATGIIRYINDPPLKNQPDRLFSGRYYCATSCNQSTDYCGVHINSGVMNKAFYLMTDGGDFNGCSINGIGKEKSGTIVYYALTRHLQQTSNFKAMYNALVKTCNELYASEAGVCDQVARALQATEMDQQPDGSQNGAKCAGAQRTAPACVSSPNPTFTPVPTVTQEPTDSITQSPTEEPTKEPTVTQRPTIPYSSPTITLRPTTVTTLTPTSTPSPVNASYLTYGHVYDKNRSGIKGEMVFFHEVNSFPGLSGSEASDNSGYYSLPDLEKATYKLGIIVGKRGYVFPDQKVTLDEQTPVAVVDFIVKGYNVPPDIIISYPAPTTVFKSKTTPVPASKSKLPVIPTSYPTMTGDRSGKLIKPTGAFKCEQDPKCLQDNKSGRMQICPLKCAPI